LLTVIGEPRSDMKRKGDWLSASRCRRRSARNSRPVRGWVERVPCFARVTASVAPAKSTWVHCRSQTSEARRPCRKAIRIMVASRCGRRLPSHPSISFSTSFSVRYSRVLTSAFLGRRGATFRFRWLVTRFSGLVLSYGSVFLLRQLSAKYPKYGKCTGLFWLV